MKRFLLSVVAVLSVMAIYAVPARRGFHDVLQSDGTTVKVQIMGDEFFHYYISESGEMLSRDSSGNFVPMSASEFQKYKVGAKTRRGMRNLPIRHAAAQNNSQVPHIGTARVPVLLVQYSDYKFKDSDPLAVFKEFFSSGDKSAHQYFQDQSNGKFDAQFDVYGPITLSGTRATYGGNDSQGYDKGVGKMVGQACTGLDSQIDFSRYDNDGDGECDVVIVLYAGDGEASSYEDDAENAVWPCQWDLSSSDYGRSLTLDKTKVNLFAVFNELNGSNLKKIDGVGTFCHEFSHCLGLPDFYDTEYGPHFGMANWSLMDYGSYNDDGYTPIGYSAYEKEFMGWIEIPEATENTRYTLPVFNQKDLATDKAVKFTNSADPDEYYILENRAQQGWDKYMPASGMLITHFTYDAYVWEANTVNDTDLQHATIIPADNDLKLDTERYYGETYYTVNEKSLLTDLWPQSNATELTDTSVPAAKVNTGKFMSKPITEIVKNEDGTISFWAMKAPLPAVALPGNLSHRVIDNTSAEIYWDCDNYNVGSYTLEVYPYIDNPFTLLADVDFTGKHGWTAGGYTIVEDGALRLGSGSQLGSVTSPVYAPDADHDCVSVVLSSKYYNSDNTSITVSLLDKSGNTVDSSAIALTSSYVDYVVKFPIKGGSEFKIKIETTVKKKRFYLSTAEVYSGDATLASVDSKRRVAESKRVFEVTGTSHVVSGLTPSGIYEYRVKANPLDTESYTSSAWSAPVLLDLSVVSSVSSIANEGNEAVEWYTLEGIRLQSKPSVRGIYIRKQGSRRVKVICP